MQKYKQISYDEKNLTVFIKTSFPACVVQSGRDAIGHSDIILRFRSCLIIDQGKNHVFLTPNEIFSKFVALPCLRDAVRQGT